MIIKIEEHNGNNEQTIIDNVTNIKLLRISNKDRYNEKELKSKVRKFVEHNFPYAATSKCEYGENKMLTALLLERNNDLIASECRLIYDSKDGDMCRCTVWLMNDKGKTVERFDY